MIELYIMRHGEAEARASADHLRKLTPYGVREVKAMCTSVAALASVEKVISSPYVRARQTAAWVSDKSRAPMAIYDGICPDSQPVSAIDFLYECCEKEGLKRIAVVSHMPFVASLVELFVAAESCRYAMPTASVAYISGDVLAKHCCELHWIKQPEL